MVRDEPIASFQFISVQNPIGPKDRTALRLARSHAVARGLENKRKLQQRSGHNFRVHVASKEEHHQHVNVRKQFSSRGPVAPLRSDSGALDLFQMLAAESPKLQTLLSQDKTHQVLEPIFSVLDELVLQNFRSVIRKGLDDQALLSAVMLTLKYAVSAAAGSINKECLGYQGDALYCIRQRMGSPDRASESTLGAILLLAGIDARLGMPRQVQLHMGAIRQLLEVCQMKGVYLSDDIKRAIFWQDLNASVMAGSSRVIDHTTFSELRWIRDPFPASFFILPSGFRSLSHLLGEEFIEVLRDVYALQCIRDARASGKEDAISIAQIDNHQASIQSRIVSLPNCSSVSECCHLAAYLCSAMLRCKMWRASTIPSHLSLQLFLKLQQANDVLVLDSQPGLVAWLLHIGGAFAPAGKLRSDYIALLHLKQSSRFRCLYNSWPELLEVLEQFIWSEDAFASQVKAFWEESCVDHPNLDFL